MGIAEDIKAGKHDADLLDITRACGQRLYDLNKNRPPSQPTAAFVGTFSEKLDLIDARISRAIDPNLTQQELNREGVAIHNQIGRLKEEVSKGDVAKAEKDRLVALTRRLLAEVFTIPPEDQDLADLSH